MVKIKFDDYVVVPLSEEYSNLILFLKGKEVYRATMPIEDINKFESRDNGEFNG